MERSSECHAQLIFVSRPSREKKWLGHETKSSLSITHEQQFQSGIFMTISHFLVYVPSSKTGCFVSQLELEWFEVK